MKLVKVTWVDAHNDAGGWHDPDELKEFVTNEAFRVISVGYLAYEGKDCVVLCSRYSPETDEYPAHYGMLERLPRKMVEHIEEITKEE